MTCNRDALRVDRLEKQQRKARLGSHRIALPTLPYRIASHRRASRESFLPKESTHSAMFLRGFEIHPSQKVIAFFGEAYQELNRNLNDNNSTILPYCFVIMILKLHNASMVYEEN
eukprot:jgi/Psemu1/299911/fgenesh1_kg.3_\